MCGVARCLKSFRSATHEFMHQSGKWRFFFCLDSIEIFATSVALKVTVATDFDSHPGPFPRDLFSAASFGGALRQKFAHLTQKEMWSRHDTTSRCEEAGVFNKGQSVFQASIIWKEH